MDEKTIEKTESRMIEEYPGQEYIRYGGNEKKIEKTQMTHIERIHTAIQHKEPDKIPKGEIGQGIDKQLVKELLGEEYDALDTEESRFQNRKKTLKLLSIDLVSIQLDYVGPSPLQEIGMDEKGHKVYEDRLWKREYISIPNAPAKTVKPTLCNPREVYDFQTPSIELYSTETIEKWKEETDYFLFPMVSGGLDQGFQLNSFEDFMLWFHTNKAEVKEWMRKMTAFSTAQAKKMVGAGVHGIVIADDLAFNSGLFVSPKLLRELYFPYLEEEVYRIKKLKVPVFLHSDGDIREILPDIVSMGFDGWQAVQAPLGVSYSEYMREIKRKWGDKLCLMGNISIDLLGRGSPEEIEEETKKLIRIAAPEGGFILSSSNELGLETKPENAIAMYYTAEKYGIYPIQ